MNRMFIYSIIGFCLVVSCFPSAALSKAISWKKLQKEIQPLQEKLPVKLDSITILTEISVQKKKKMIVYSHSIQTENIDQIDTDFMQRYIIANDCAKENSLILSSKIKRMRYSYTANDGRSKSFEISRNDCINGKPFEDSFSEFEHSIQQQNQNLPLEIDSVTTLFKISTNHIEKSLTHHNSVNIDSMTEQEAQMIRDSILRGKCDKFNDLWRIPLLKINYEYTSLDKKTQSFSIGKQDCDNVNIKVTWKEFEKGISIDRKNLPQKINPQLTLKEIQTNVEKETLIYVYTIDMETITEELPIIKNLRHLYLQDNCRVFSGFLGNPVQNIDFLFYAADNTTKSTTLTVEDCKAGISE